VSLGPPEIVAAIIGAIAAGLFQLADRILARRRRSQAVLVAIATEVRSILDLIEHRRYLQVVSEAADAIREKARGGHTLIIDIRSNYFSVFESLAAELGLLKPAHIRKIVAFYAFCRSVIDSTRPDGPHVTTLDEEDKANNIIELEGLLIAIVHLGHEIVRFPRQDIPPAIEDEAIAKRIGTVG
jgi:hypothetical protein